jgi:hypothetical protein
MEAIVVRPDNLATLSFASNILVIFTDNVAFGDDNLLQTVRAEQNQALLHISKLPSIPNLFVEGSVCSSLSVFADLGN